MRIAIVDDCLKERTLFCERIKLQLTKRNINAHIEEFSSGEEFLKHFEPKMYSVVFLDIYMDKLTGFDVARELYEKDMECKIVFLTSSKDFLLDSYSVRATYYLLKPLDVDRLCQALDFCFPVDVKNDMFIVRTKHGTQVISRKKILYIESVLRHGLIHLDDSVIESMDSFANVTEPLIEDNRFLLCGRGIMVGLHQVIAQEGNEFILNNKVRVPISRRFHSYSLKKFKEFALLQMGKVVT